MHITRYCSTFRAGCPFLIYPGVKLSVLFSYPPFILLFICFFIYTIIPPDITLVISGGDYVFCSISLLYHYLVILTVLLCPLPFINFSYLAKFFFGTLIFAFSLIPLKALFPIFSLSHSLPHSTHLRMTDSDAKRDRPHHRHSRHCRHP